MLAVHGGRDLIVGAGQAAVQAIDTLRRRASPARSRSSARSRSCPTSAHPSPRNTSSGALERDRLLIRPAHFYADHAVETRLGRRATRDRPRDARRGAWMTARALAYDKLLLATGSVPRRLPAPGADLEGVHILRIDRRRGEHPARLRTRAAAGDRRRGLHRARSRGDRTRTGARGHGAGDGGSGDEPGDVPGDLLVL